MKDKKDYLMIAYVMFLAFIMLYRILCLHTNQSFDNWNNIVMAVTISSYSFALADMFKSKRDLLIEKNYKDEALKEKLDDFVILVELEQCDEEYKNDIISSCSEIKDGIDKSIKDACASIDSCKGTYGFTTIMGFLLFLIVSLTDIVKDDANSLELCTVLAFFIILFTELINNGRKQKLNKEYECTNQRIDKLIKTQKSNVLTSIANKNTEEKDGQAENGD